MKGGSRTVDAYMQMQYTHISREGRAVQVTMYKWKEKEGKEKRSDNYYKGKIDSKR